jgi:orotidine-5'-phosphate decarboxylase
MNPAANPAANPEAPFTDRLAAKTRACQTPLVVGLDPRKERLPHGLLPDAWGDEMDAVAQAYKMFCFGIIDVVADLVPAVKPQMAFFEQLGLAGLRAMKQVIGYAHSRDLLVILDGKRNDIGSTAEAYADAYLGRQSVWQADALTVNPYLGSDSLTPFVGLAHDRGAGLFVLVKTSNPGSGSLQDRLSDSRPIYEHVAEMIEKMSVNRKSKCGYGAVGAVVGATYPQHLATLRQIMPSAWLLVPGVGAQGGTVADVAGAFDSNGLGAIVSCSRSVIFAYDRPEYTKRFGHTQWQEAVDAATRDTIDQLRAVVKVRV